MGYTFLNFHYEREYKQATAMKVLTVLLVSLCFLTTTINVSAKESSYNPFSIYNTIQDAPARSSQIRGIQVFGKSSGIAYTSDAVYRTDDNGESWYELPIGRLYPLRLANVRFHNESFGTALFVDRSNYGLVRFDTHDAGESWLETSIGKNADLAHDIGNADLDSAKIWIDEYGAEQLEFKLTTGSNFHLTVNYSRMPSEADWDRRRLHETEPEYADRTLSLKDTWGPFVKDFPDRVKAGFLPEDPVVLSDKNDFHKMNRVHTNWYVTQSGICAGFKSGCVQTTRVYRDISTEENRVTTVSYQEITPPQLVELNLAEKEAARLEADQNRMFAAPPGGSIRTSLNRGFDKCQAGSVAQMQIWWDQSYHFDSNIYFSGRNRACPSQPFTGNPSWIDQVSAMGWGLIPTVVGYQSPCTSSTTTAKLSYDPATAEQQGRGEADIAANDAAAIGLTSGSVLYYDMERYDPPTPDTLGCRTATVAFLKGWTERIKQLGYVSGVYGSPKNAIEDWQAMPPASRMDAVWMARWDNVATVWTYVTFPTFPNNVWDNHQRIKQWQAPHNETWGGVTFNIDGNISDGPVAGVPVPRNKVADFDGDQKTDVSVFRPATGEWFISGTLGPSFTVYTFGAAEDLLVPGDYDGDGKTDFAVFRPSDSSWHFRMKGVYTARQYGQVGDIPAQGDFDGDRRTDVAVFRPSTGTWFIAFSDSRNTFAEVQFGQNGDRPAVADYDGDGKADIAIWRPSDGNWHVQGSAGNYFAAAWGQNGDIPAQADYDGDGRADLVVFRPSEGNWYLSRTTAGIHIQQFGVNGDLPATGDFDGDGRYDVAVFRPSDNTWYMSQSQNGYVVRPFGANGDKTIPGAYLPR